ncbi:hypothetical protein BD311DRAFT_348462 [Dichomitus squalens]|uniref:Uncharacterized protein n=1 Tax=Dichomitus squalens TaxID=114155 RepID=A0A4Q9N5A4_9APHY|nr:hypothetical protein BD311DRAFT_348462 [Dichomitus squalens]
MLAEDEYLAFDNDLREFDPDDYLDSCIEEVDSSPPPLADPPPRTHARSTLYENYTRALSNSMEAGGMSLEDRVLACIDYMNTTGINLLVTASRDAVSTALTCH